MAAPASSQTPISKAPTAKSIQGFPRTSSGCNDFSSSSRSPAAFPATPRRRRRARIHEGGELGYSLSPCLRSRVRQSGSHRLLRHRRRRGGDRGRWRPVGTGNKFLNPTTDGAVLPILHLNGYKIANPTVLARIPEDELTSLLVGYGYKPTMSRATIRCGCIRSWPPPSKPC